MGGIEYKLSRFADGAVYWWLDTWLNPWMWVLLAAVMFILTLIGTKPITMPVADEETSAATVMGVFTRQASWWSIVAAWVFLPAGVLGLGSINHDLGTLSDVMIQASIKSMAYWWKLPLTAWLLALLLTFTYHRYCVAWLSALQRKWRLRQSGEELSDIRVERQKLQPKNFVPTKYYKKDRMFLGLDERGKAVLMPDKDWRSMHTKIIGPTQTGKGVLLGVTVDQIIAKGWGCFVIDPKPDLHLKEIMKQACERHGRKFMELDLNEGSAHRWAPFAGGTVRQRRARLMAAFGLEDSGDGADFYKAAERAELDRILPHWSGDLLALRNLINSQNMQEKMARVLSYVDEWSSVSTYLPQKGRGFSVERAYTENAVVWVRASLTDTLVIQAATMFIMEVMQEGMRLYRNGRTAHTSIVVDEVRFMISETLANALATVAGAEMNVMLAYQSLLDLRALRDKSLNAQSIEESVNVNCKITLCYQAANFETAEWAAQMSGTVQKATTRMEKVKVGRYGVEEWEADRTLARTEAALISENIMLSLPSRVGVFFRPGHLATVLYTAWIPVTLPTVDTTSKSTSTTSSTPVLEKPPRAEETLQVNRIKQIQSQSLNASTPEQAVSPRAPQKDARQSEPSTPQKAKANSNETRGKAPLDRTESSVKTAANAVAPVPNPIQRPTQRPTQREDARLTQPQSTASSSQSIIGDSTKAEGHSPAIATTAHSTTVTGEPQSAATARASKNEGAPREPASPSARNTSGSMQGKKKQKPPALAMPATRKDSVAHKPDRQMSGNKAKAQREETDAFIAADRE